MSPHRRLAVAAALVAQLAACATAPRPTTVSLPRSEDPHADYREADDGPHPSSEPAWFEWWYYDATFDDGTSATVALYAASMFTRRGPPGVLVNVLDRSGKSHTSYAAFPDAPPTYGAPGEIAVGRSSAKRLADGRVHVSARGQTEDGDPLAVELTFTPRMPGFKVGTGEVRFDGKVALGWVVPMPRADVEGTVRVRDEERAVKGFGYHDHNWGELSLTNTMGHWYWGRVATEDLTAVYASITFREEIGLPPLRILVAGDAQRLTRVLGDVRIEPFAERHLAQAGRDVPTGLTIEGDGTRLRLTERRVVEEADLSHTLGAVRPLVRLFTRPAYVRTLCDYEWTSASEGLPPRSAGAALVEYMYVWKP